MYLGNRHYRQIFFLSSNNKAQTIIPLQTQPETYRDFGCLKRSGGDRYKVTIPGLILKELRKTRKNDGKGAMTTGQILTH